MVKIIARKEYLLWLPKKRMAAGAIIMNDDNNILVLKTSYKESWEIPGEVTEKWESPKVCANREIQEELWIDIVIWDVFRVLLVFLSYVYFWLMNNRWGKSQNRQWRDYWNKICSWERFREIYHS